jgi:DNA-binding transcriptional regulator YhcF (GntR family)
VSGPKYQQVADTILSKIAAGEVAGEITLGRIRELTGATDSTSRAAAKRLVSARILENHPGAPYAVRVTAGEAAAARLDRRPLEEQVAELRREVDELRERIGRMDAQIAAAGMKPHGGNRDQAKAAAGGGRR